MRRDYVKELRENDRLQESISGSGCPGVLFLLKRNSNLRLEMKESGNGKTAVRMLPFFCCQTAGTALECFRISIFTELF